MTTLEMEIALAAHFNHRQNLIVPNVHWGFFIHEIDLLVVTKAGYAYEVEIKVSKADLVKDKDKRHQHHDSRGRIKYLYFAIPGKLVSEISHIPARAGIVTVKKYMATWGRYGTGGYEKYEKEAYDCQVIRQPETLGAYKFSDSERYAIARLGALRIWSMKDKLLKIARDEREIKLRGGG